MSSHLERSDHTRIHIISNTVSSTCQGNLGNRYKPSFLTTLAPTLVLVMLVWVKILGIRGAGYYMLLRTMTFLAMWNVQCAFHILYTQASLRNMTFFSQMLQEIEFSDSYYATWQCKYRTHSHTHTLMCNYIPLLLTIVLLFHYD